MIMDLNNAGLLCDDPRAVSAKELEDFLRKYKMLNADEIAKSFRVTCEDIILIVGQTVPCVGCRRR